MKKITLVGIVFLLASCYSAIAVLDTTNLVMHISMDDDWTSGAVAVDQSTNGYNASIVGAATGNTTAAINQSYHFDGTNDHVTIDHDEIGGASQPRTYNMWIYRAGSDEDVLMRHRDADGDVLWKWRTNGSVTLETRAAGWVGCTTQSLATSKWHMITMAWDGSYLACYLNGTLIENNSQAAPLNTNSNPFCLGENCIDASEDYTGNLDEFSIWNRSLSSSDISDLWNSGTGRSFPFDGGGGGGGGGGGDTINISDALPPNDEIINTELLNINATVNATNTFNCSLYTNSTLNQTRTGFSAGSLIDVSFNLTASSDTQTNIAFYISCYDGTNVSNSTESTVYIDNVDPTITVSSSLASNFSISYGNVNISADVNLSDPNLYGLNISVDGTTTIFNITSIGASTYNYALNFDPADYGITPGVHTLAIYASDDHTLNEIPEFDYSRNIFTNSIKYKFGDGWIKVEPINEGLFSDFRTWKETDRYVFNFEKDLMEKHLYDNTLEFKVSSSHYLDLIGDSSYPGHIVSPDLSKWIDFDSEHKNAKVSTQRVNNETILVTITGIDADSITFNSIGGLNVENRNYTFYYGNITEEYVSRTAESGETLFSLNFTINDSFIGDIGATFNYNNETYTPTKVNDTGSYYFSHTHSSDLFTGATNYTNYTFSWNYSVTNEGAGNNITNSTSDTNQSVYKMILSNCTNSLATTESINFSIEDQVFETPAFTTAEGSFTIWTGNSSKTRTYGIDWVNNTNHPLCLYPSFTNLSTNYEFLYTGFGDTNSRIRTNDTLTNTSTKLTLYIFESGDDISITVVDENDDGLNNVEVEAWQYDTVAANYSLVAEETTDPDGLAVMRLYTEGEDQYRFLIYDGATLLFTSDTFKLYKTAYTFRIVFGDIPTSTLINLQNLDYNLSVDNGNGNFTLTWDDTITNLTSVINLTVVKTNLTDDVIQYSATSSAVTGTLHYNVSDSGVYNAFFYATAESDGNVYLVDSVSYDIREEWDVFGVDALIMSFIFIGTMAFIGVAVSGSAAIMLTLFGMLMFYIFGFIQVSLSGIIALIVVGIIIMVKLRR